MKGKSAASGLVSLNIRKQRKVASGRFAECKWEINQYGDNLEQIVDLGGLHIELAFCKMQKFRVRP